MRTRLRFCVFVACALSGLAAIRANDDAAAHPVAAANWNSDATGGYDGSGSPAPKLTDQDAKSLADWAQRQAELAVARGESSQAVREAQELATWARAQADQQATGGAPVVTRRSTFPAAFSQVEDQPESTDPLPGLGSPQPRSASQERVVDAALSQGGQEELPGPNTPPIPTDDMIVDGNPPEFWGDVWGACCVCCQSGLVLGVEGTFLAPINEPNTGVVLTNLVTGEQFEGVSDPGLGAGVRSWLGFQNCTGTGFVFRHWAFGNQVIDPNPVVPVNAPPAFQENYYLSAYTLDIELTQQFCVHGTRWNASFGARYARLERNQFVVGYGSVGDVNLLGLAMAANELEGAGFTSSLYFRHPLQGCCMPCGWNLYGGFRGSLLWADTIASALTEANAVVLPPIGAAQANAQDKAFATMGKDTIFIAEFQAGIQYEHCLPCTCALFFVRAGFEYQHWNTGDPFARTNSFAFLAGGPPVFGGRVDARADAHDGDLDLAGLVLGAGITY